jgi:hypothetical protein
MFLAQARAMESGTLILEELSLKPLYRQVLVQHIQDLHRWSIADSILPHIFQGKGLVPVPCRLCPKLRSNLLFEVLARIRRLDCHLLGHSRADFSLAVMIGESLHGTAGLWRMQQYQIQLIGSDAHIVPDIRQIARLYFEMISIIVLRRCR